jgi:hypothetical protein
MDILFGIAISLHVASDGGEYNAIHPHIRVQEESYIAGYYLNSIDRNSLYVGKEFELSEDLSLDLGLVTGYRSDNKVVPFARLSYKEGFMAPHVVDEKLEGIVLGYEFALKR